MSLARLPTSPPPPRSRTQIAALKTAMAEADEFLLKKFKPVATPTPTPTPAGCTVVPPHCISTEAGGCFEGTNEKVCTECQVGWTLSGNVCQK